MSVISHLNNYIVAALVAVVGFSGPLAAQEALSGEALVDDLLRQLREAEPGQDARLVRAIQTEWSKSGSAAVDLLLQRGGEALEAGEFLLASEHFTAAIDHAPDFAEAYSARANAYYRLDMIGPAIDDLARALVLNPNNFIALRGFGVILEEMGREEAALEVYEQVLAIYPAEMAAGEAVERLKAQLRGEAL